MKTSSNIAHNAEWELVIVDGRTRSGLSIFFCIKMVS